MARSSRWKDASASAQAPVPPPGTPVVPAPPQGPAPVMQAPAPQAPYAPAPAPQQFAAQAAPFAPPVAGTPAPQAPAPGRPVEGEVAELKSSLADLAATVAELVERTQAPGVPAPVAGGTSDTDQVSRIIVMANRTAETTIEDARTEAAGIVASAKTQSFEIIRMARELANQELAAERDRVARSTEAWLVKRAEVTDRLRQLESTFDGYQQGLGGVGESIRAAVVQLESDDAALPVIEALPAPDPSGFIGTELPDAAAPASDGEAELDVDPSAPAADGAAPDEVIDLTDEAVLEQLGGGEAEEQVAATPGRTSLFGGSPTLGAPAGNTPPAWPAPEAPAVNEEPGSNLRPGLFGR